jgi:hypothetical protein
MNNNDATQLFNGQNLSGWQVPEGDNGHWQVVDGVIDYDAMSESPKDKNLWTEQRYGDFELWVDWRIKSTPWTNTRVPIVLPDGTYKRNEHGEVIRMSVPDSDSGILLRGTDKAQVNIWCWPVGSGEVYGYRTDAAMSAEVKRGVTPRTIADRHIGEWNTFHIIVKGNRLTVHLNDTLVIDDAELPGLPSRGPIGLQHHGIRRDNQWVTPPSLVQFRNIYIKEL